MPTSADEVRAALQELAAPSRVYAAGDVAATQRLLGDAEAARVDLDMAPYRFDSDMTPEAAGVAIADGFARIAAEDAPCLPALLAAVCDRAGCPPGQPERRAGLVAAVLASVPNGNAYHNPAHTREVLAGGIWLLGANAALAARGAAGAAAPGPAGVARFALLAAMHDIGHDGAGNVRTDRHGRKRRVPHRLEDRSFGLMEGVLARAGFTAGMIETMRAIIRATDVALRPAARQLTDHLLLGAPAPAEVPHALAPLRHDREAAALAALLADADVLPSAALTPAYQRLQNARLQQEAEARFSRADMLAFFDVIVGGDMATAGGRLLGANLRRIRAAVAAQPAQEGAPEAG